MNELQSVLGAEIHCDYEPQRPFRKKRPQVLSNLKDLFFDTCHFVADKTSKIANSLLGQTIKFAGADLAGSLVGKAAGEAMMTEAMEKVGKLAVPSAIVGGALVGSGMALYSLKTKASTTAKLIFSVTAAVSVVVWINYSIEELTDFGSSAGALIGQQIGGLAGAIFGGYSALVLSGSPIEFFGENGYSKNMLRYHGTGLAFDALIRRSTVPIISPLFNIPRGIVHFCAQNAAYNSTATVQLIDKFVRSRRIPNKTLTLFFTQLITNRLSGTIQNSLQIKPEINSSFMSALSGLRAIFNKGIKIGIQQGAEAFFINNVELIVLIALRSFHKYTYLIKKSNPIQSAHHKLKIAIFDKPHLTERNKADLVEALNQEFFQQENFPKQLAIKILDVLIQDLEIKRLMKTLIIEIQKLEKEVVGLQFLEGTAAEYFEEIATIYLHHYIVYTLVHYKTLSQNKLVSAEDMEIILEINRLTIYSYFHLISPPKFAMGVHYFTEKVITVVFKTMSFLNDIIQQSRKNDELTKEKYKQLIRLYFEEADEVELIFPYEGEYMEDVDLRSSLEQQIHQAIHDTIKKPAKKQEIKMIANFEPEEFKNEDDKNAAFVQAINIAATQKMYIPKDVNEKKLPKINQKKESSKEGIFSNFYHRWLKKS